MRVKPVNGGAQAGLQGRIAIRPFGWFTFRANAIRPYDDVGTLQDGITILVAKQFEGDLFDFGFVQNHGLSLEYNSSISHWAGLFTM